MTDFCIKRIHSDGPTARQESRAVARKPRDAAAVLFGLKLADNIHYKFLFNSSQASKARLQTGAVLRWGRGHMPQIHLLPPPPDLKASWPFWLDFWGPIMLRNPNFSPGLRSGPRWGRLQRSPKPLTDGRGSLPLCQEPHPRSRPFEPRFYGSQGLTHYRVGNPTNDRFQK